MHCQTEPNNKYSLGCIHLFDRLMLLLLLWAYIHIFELGKCSLHENREGFRSISSSLYNTWRKVVVVEQNIWKSSVLFPLNLLIMQAVTRVASSRYSFLYVCLCPPTHCNIMRKYSDRKQKETQKVKKIVKFA